MDPDADPAIFVSDLHDVNKNLICLLLFGRTFTSFSKTKIHKKSHKTVVINVFLTIFLDDRKIRIRIQVRISD
jgi:hypothetical protein